VSIKASISLLFSGEIKVKLVKLSQAVNTISPSPFVLSDATPPHITLFSFTSEDNDIRMPAKMYAVSFTGLMQLGDKGGRIWVAIGVNKTPGLEEFRKELIGATGTPKLERGEFIPHVTLANVPAAEFDKISAAIGATPLLKLAHTPCRTGRFIQPI